MVKNGQNLVHVVYGRPLAVGLHPALTSMMAEDQDDPSFIMMMLSYVYVATIYKLDGQTTPTGCHISTTNPLSLRLKMANFLLLLQPSWSKTLSPWPKRRADATSPIHTVAS